MNSKLSFFLVFFMSSFVNMNADLQESGIACVAKFEKDPDFIEKVFALGSTIDIFEVLGDYGRSITDEELSDLIEKAVKNDPSIARCRVDKYGNTLAHIAACRFMPDEYVMLVEKYVDLEQVENGWGLTPRDFLAVCEIQRNEGMKKQIHQGKFKEKYGALQCVKSSLDTSMGESLKAGKAWPDVFKVLGDYGYFFTKLSEQEWKTFEELIESAILKNPQLLNCAIDENGNTLLHIAACHNAERFTKFLLNHGANFKAKNGWGLTPVELQEICQRRRTAMQQ